MDKSRIILSVLCLGLFLEAGAQERRLLKFAEPEQQVDTVRFDSGTVALYYPFKNVSGKDVIILEVHSGCGCFFRHVAGAKDTDHETLRVVITGHFSIVHYQFIHYVFFASSQFMH